MKVILSLMYFIFKDRLLKTRPVDTFLNFQWLPGQGSKKIFNFQGLLPVCLSVFMVNFCFEQPLDNFIDFLILHKNVPFNDPLWKSPTCFCFIAQYGWQSRKNNNLKIFSLWISIMDIYSYSSCMYKLWPCVNIVQSLLSFKICPKAP